MICRGFIGQHTLSLQRSRGCPSLCSRVSRSSATLSPTSWVSLNGKTASGSDNCCLGHQQLVHCVVGHIVAVDTSSCLGNGDSLDMSMTETRIWQCGKQSWKAAKVMLAFLAEPSRKSINQRLLIWQLEVCSVVWIREMIIGQVPLRGVGAGLDPSTKACQMTIRYQIAITWLIYTRYILGIY